MALRRKWQTCRLVKSAIKNSILQYPITKITVNLAPADTKKEGPVYDLPIAIGILSARGYVKVIEKKFHPTEIGIETTEKLQEYFKDIINIETGEKL